MVGQAFDGKTALKMIDQFHPDIVSLDLQLPKMSGLEVLSELHNSPRNTVVVMVSGANDAETIRQSFELGALGYVTKPFCEERILSVFGYLATIIARRNSYLGHLQDAPSPIKRAVIIDGSTTDRDQLRIILESAGYCVAAEAEGGMAGLIALEKKQPDFVCHSVDLPEISGLNVLACIRAVHPNLPVIIISRHSDMETVKHAVAGGVKGYIIKPFNPETILSLVQRIAP